jgi:hypothetical protein
MVGGRLRFEVFFFNGNIIRLTFSQFHVQQKKLNELPKNTTTERSIRNKLKIRKIWGESKSLLLSTGTDQLIDFIALRSRMAVECNQIDAKPEPTTVLPYN